MTTKTTQATKVATALVNGAELTAKQISSRYGVKNVREVRGHSKMKSFTIYGLDGTRYYLRRNCL